MKGTLRRKALAFWKRRTRKGNRYCLFVWAWSLVYIPLSLWNIATSDNMFIRAAYGFAILSVGFMVGMHRAGHLWAESTSRWDWLTMKTRRLLCRVIDSANSHTAEHVAGWWAITPKGVIERAKEH